MIWWNGELCGTLQDNSVATGKYDVKYMYSLYLY